MLSLTIYQIQPELMVVPYNMKTTGYPRYTMRIQDGHNNFKYIHKKS